MAKFSVDRIHTLEYTEYTKKEKMKGNGMGLLIVSTIIGA